MQALRDFVYNAGANLLRSGKSEIPLFEKTAATAAAKENKEKSEKERQDLFSDADIFKKE